MHDCQLLLQIESVNHINFHVIFVKWCDHISYNLSKWCNLGKSVWSWTCDISSFLFWLKCLFGEVHFAENPSESDQWFQSYEQLTDSQNNTKEINTFFWLYLTINTPDFQMIKLDRNTYDKYNLPGTDISTSSKMTMSPVMIQVIQCLLLVW